MMMKPTLGTVLLSFFLCLCSSDASRGFRPRRMSAKGGHPAIPSASFQGASVTTSATSPIDAAAATKMGPKSFQAPPWAEILKIPIPVPTQEDFDLLPPGKRLGIMARSSVLHLTLLSCLGPLILRGAIRSALKSPSSIPFTPGLALLWTLDVTSWHAFHNMLNDWQDLDGDDKAPDSFRSDYGCHALKQGFVTKAQFARYMTMLGLPGIILTIYFAVTKSVVAPASPWGLAALALYTILFKPLALGEVFIYLVWGPLMAGYGGMAAGVPNSNNLADLFTSPVSALFGLGAFCVIMGKHTDKINRSEKKTLPKLVGYPVALFLCGASLLAPHVLLLATLVYERILHPDAVPTIPLGAGLAFLTLFRELPASLKVLRLGQIKNNQPTIPAGTIIKGTLEDVEIYKSWPLWFVAFLGWHAITFSYLVVVGSGMEWMGRAILKRVIS
ncbi:UbiA prenyltransferase family [Seminavis robusta]|uniref:UbiA prenyltransferase family n=1 Tax=Seminavis robusta TaxID=568900 RepID=A0A9N8E1X2_9STRA|nr:UbiA prenyltransferase family [Seminavis robusta]|eukprot:Sro566_g167730.1 UbiA prenyltransferase family (444) ;mRNA; r:3278-4609